MNSIIEYYTASASALTADVVPVCSRVRAVVDVHTGGLDVRVMQVPIVLDLGKHGEQGSGH